MDKKTAFKIVYDELAKYSLFKGVYDAKNGSKDYIYGIATIMDFIAYNISEEVADEFSSEFTYNMIESEEKAERGE